MTLECNGGAAAVVAEDDDVADDDYDGGVGVRDRY